MQPVYVDIHIHTSEDPQNVNDNYDIKTLIGKISEKSLEKPVLISLSDHNTINKKAYIELCKYMPNVLLGVELHIRKYDEAPPYHCHVLFNCEVTETNIDEINKILDALYPKKKVEDDFDNIPNIEVISNAFDAYEYILLPHGGQSHRTFDKATGKGHRFDTSMERSVYYNHFDGFTARSNSGLEDTIAYFKRLGIDQFTNLITCTDNYNPKVYPSGKDKDAEPFVPTWVLSEPTFAGLKLALSESSRLYYGDVPPERWGQSLYGINLNADKCHIDVIMSPGLNVVIGGSSSGKTLFVDSLVRGAKRDFSGSNYLGFGVENILIKNPSGVIPHYINQNFIVEVLRNNELDIGDIALIREVFPEDKDVTQRIRDGLSKLQKLVEKMVDSVEEYEKNLDAMTHLNNPASLIITKKIPKPISSFIKPSNEDKNRYNLSQSDYIRYEETLQEISDTFEKSLLDISYKNEIKTLKNGLAYLLSLSELSEKISLTIESVFEKEIRDRAEDDRDNTSKTNQRLRLGECVSEALKALSSFTEAKEELGRFNIEVSSKELIVSDHHLKIQNSFKLTKTVIVDAINRYLKHDKKIKDFSEMCPEILFKEGFSQKPKVESYKDFATRIYNDICANNKNTYRITTSDGRDFDKLSPGWKSAVLLDLILGYNGDVAPLIIDQPEDNLATDYINHGLVDRIKKIKPQKQVILVSHNATIPMLGDAQNVIICRNIDGKIEIKSAALESFVDGKRVLDLIAEITDGGKPSIRKRVKKYDLRKYTGEA